MKKTIFVFVLLLTFFAKAEKKITLRLLYNKGTNISQLAKDLEGEYVTIQGYMAPPLESMSKFFVLTKRPLSVCPFCETEADWPDDILAIYTKRVIKIRDFNDKISVRGILRLGKFVDETMGFVSMVRLENAVYE